MVVNCRVKCTELLCTALRCDHSHGQDTPPLTAQVTGVSLAAVTLLEPHLQVCLAQPYRQHIC
jgi:hypothetical protein